MAWWIESRWNEVFQPVLKTGNLDVKEYDNTWLKVVKIREALDSLEIPEDKQSKLIERILKYSDNKELFNNILEQIKASFDEADILLILGKTEKSKDKTEKSKDKTEKSKDKTEANDNEKEKNKQKEFLEKIKLLIPLDWKHKESYDDIIGLLNWKKLDDKTYESVILKLKNPGKLASIVDDLGWINSTKYIEFRKTLIWIDPSFIDIFDPIDVWVISYKAKALLGVSKLSDDTNLGLNTLTNKTDDWFEITAIRWGKRNLSLEWSKYDLNASFDNSNEIKEINIVENELQKETESINNILKSISILLKYVNQAITDGIELSDIKSTLKLNNSELYNELGMDSISSISDIKQKLSWFYKQKELEKKEIIIGKRKKLDKIISNIDKKSSDADKIKKETLRFIQSIGFDMIPQSITDSIISQLNSNDSLRNSLGFQNNINLEEWNLWTNKDHNLLKINNAEKVVFAEFVNKMISWEKIWPINIEAIKTWSWEPISNRSTFLTHLMSFQEWGAIGFALNNLKQENNNN